MKRKYVWYGVFVATIVGIGKLLKNKYSVNDETKRLDEDDNVLNIKTMKNESIKLGYTLIVHIAGKPRFSGTIKYGEYTDFISNIKSNGLHLETRGHIKKQYELQPFFEYEIIGVN